MSDDRKRIALLNRVKRLKAAIQLQLQEAIEIERELEGIHLPDNSKRFKLSVEDSVKNRAASMARRGININ